MARTPRILFPFLAAAWLMAAISSADDPAALKHFRDGVSLEKSKRLEDAAAEFQACLEKDPAYAPAMKQLGNCLYGTKDLTGALQAYQDYLKLQPGDRQTAAFVNYLKGKIAVQSGGDASSTGPGSNLDKRHRLKDNPRDDKHVQLLLGLGRFDIYHFDISYFTSRENNFGLSYSQIPAGLSSFSLFEPRYRRYMADWYVAPFVEGGVMFGSTSFKSGNTSTDLSIFGAVLGFGVSVMGRGAWTTEFALSYPMGNFSSKSQTSDINYYGDQNTSNYSGTVSIWGLPLPMPSFAFGLVF